MALFEGAGVALITPMKENHEINFDKLDELLEEQIAGQTDAIIICGTTIRFTGFSIYVSSGNTFRIASSISGTPCPSIRII